MECLVTGAVCDGATGTCSCPASMYLDGMTCRNSKHRGFFLWAYAAVVEQSSAEKGAFLVCL